MEASVKGKIGRRAFLGSSAVVATSAVALQASPASAASAVAYTKTPLPTARELHALRRWTYGYTPAALTQLRNAGGPEAWLEAQLSPEAIQESARAEIEDWWVCITADAPTIVQRDQDEVESGWEAMTNYSRWSLLRRMNTNRHLLEKMTEFWEDHLYIPVYDDGVYPFRIDFGRRMRELALTSFEELLLASTTHPAMGCSLDNAGSQKKAVNENLGRELLELHTVGQGHYSEADVRNSAYILTGYRVAMWRSWDVYYDTASHWTGPVRVMDFTDPNGSSDGRAVTERYLSYLAQHPATAERVCRKLAKRFAQDEPSQALVDALTEAYLANRSQIKPVLRALFAQPDFWATAGRKVKTPTDETVALYRALDVRFVAPTRDNSGANSFIWTTENLGSLPWSHPRPDGPPTASEDWVNPSRFLGSWESHWTAAGGWWPSNETTWHERSYWLPQASLTLAEFVDHLSRRLLGEASTDALLTAAVAAVQEPASTVVTSSHALANWKLPFLLALVLNSPSFYLQ